MKNTATRVSSFKKKKGEIQESQEENKHSYVSYAFSFLRTIKDDFILIFLGITNASPLWVR